MRPYPLLALALFVSLIAAAQIPFAFHGEPLNIVALFTDVPVAVLTWTIYMEKRKSA